MILIGLIAKFYGGPSFSGGRRFFGYDIDDPGHGVGAIEG